MVRLLVSSTAKGSLNMDATKARTKTKRMPARDDSSGVRTKSQPHSRQDEDRTVAPSQSTPQNSQEKNESVSSTSKNTSSSAEKSPTKTISAGRKQKQKSRSLKPAQPAESNTTGDASKARSNQEKEGIVSSTLEKTITLSKKPPTKMISADQSQTSKSKSKSSMSVQSAETKPLKVFRRSVPGLSMESKNDPVGGFLSFGIPRSRPKLLSQARVKRKPAPAPSTRPKPVKEKAAEDFVLFKHGGKGSNQSKVLQGSTQDAGKMKTAPIASPQPQADYKKSDKSSAANTQSPSSSKDAQSIEVSYRKKKAAGLERKSHSLVTREPFPVTSTQPKPSLQNPPDEAIQCRVHSETADTFKKGTISDPATDATVRDRLIRTNTSVGDGAICHVRVTLGNLSGVFTSRDPSSSNSRPQDRDNDLVVGYAEMVTLASEVDDSVQLTNSIPITPQMGDDAESPFHIVWSNRKKGDPKTRNRLYFSVAMEQEGGNFEHSLIRVGVRRGEQKIPLGLVPIQVGENSLEREKFYLALQPIEPRRRKGFFWDGELDTSKHSFRNDDLIYKLSDKGLLRVRIEVKKGVYENSGPVLWRDVVRNDEVDVRLAGNFLDASLRGSHLTIQDEKKNSPLSKVEKAAPLPFVEKASYITGVEKRSESVEEERDDFMACSHILGSPNEGRDGLPIAAGKDEMGKGLHGESDYPSGVQVDKKGSMQREERSSNPITESSVIDVRPEVESLVESTEESDGTNSAWNLKTFLWHKLDNQFSVSQTLITLGEEESALNDLTQLEEPEVATTERVENSNYQGSLLVNDKLNDTTTVPGGGAENSNDRYTLLLKDNVPSGDDYSTYTPGAEDGTQFTESSDDSSDVSAVEKQSGFEMALLRLHDNLSLPDVIDHAANIIYGEAVRVGLYSYGSSDSSEVTNTSSLNDGINLYTNDSSCDKDTSVASKKVKDIYDISIGLPPSPSSVEYS
jgi:hypothetical protein